MKQTTILLIKRLAVPLAALLWGLFIFLQSAKNGTDFGQMSDGIVLMLQQILPISREILSALVRKAAHVTEYFIFSALLCISAHQHRLLLRPFDLSVLFIGTMWAVCDEWIQTFVPGRAGCVQDVLIDVSGVIAAFFLFRLLIRSITKKKERNQNSCSVSSAICEKPSQNSK